MHPFTFLIIIVIIIFLLLFDELFCFISLVLSHSSCVDLKKKPKKKKLLYSEWKRFGVHCTWNQQKTKKIIMNSMYTCNFSFHFKWRNDRVANKEGLFVGADWAKNKPHLHLVCVCFFFFFIKFDHLGSPVCYFFYSYFFFFIFSVLFFSFLVFLLFIHILCVDGLFFSLTFSCLQWNYSFGCHRYMATIIWL